MLPSRPTRSHAASATLAVAAVVLALLLVPRPASAVIPIKDFPVHFFQSADTTRVYVNNGSRTARAPSTATTAVLDRMFAQRYRGLVFGKPGSCTLIASGHVRCASAIIRRSDGARVGTAALHMYGSASSSKVRSVRFSWR